MSTSEDMVAGTPNLGIISLRSTFVTSWALLLWAGKASRQPEKVSVSTKRHLYLPFLGSSEKSICHYCSGRLPFPIVPKLGLLVVWGWLWRQSLHCFVISITVVYRLHPTIRLFKLSYRASAPQCALLCSSWTIFHNIHSGTTICPSGRTYILFFSCAFKSWASFKSSFE